MTPVLPTPGTGGSFSGGRIAHIGNAAPTNNYGFDDWLTGDARSLSPKTYISIAKGGYALINVDIAESGVPNEDWTRQFSTWYLASGDQNVVSFSANEPLGMTEVTTAQSNVWIYGRRAWSGETEITLNAGNGADASKVIGPSGSGAGEAVMVLVYDAIERSLNVYRVYDGDAPPLLDLGTALDASTNEEVPTPAAAGFNRVLSQAVVKANIKQTDRTGAPSMEWDRNNNGCLDVEDGQNLFSGLRNAEVYILTLLDDVGFCSSAAATGTGLFVVGCPIRMVYRLFGDVESEGVDERTYVQLAISADRDVILGNGDKCRIGSPSASPENGFEFEIEQRCADDRATNGDKIATFAVKGIPAGTYPSAENIVWYNDVLGLAEQNGRCACVEGIHNFRVAVHEVLHTRSFGGLQHSPQNDNVMYGSSQSNGLILRYRTVGALSVDQWSAIRLAR